MIQASSTFDEFLQTSEPFTTIMYSMPISPERLRLLQEYGKEHQTPLVAIHSVGFYGYFSVSLPGTFPIVDTHPDETATTDLRLLSPWPELSEFAKEMTKDIDTMDNHEHGHLPLVVILLHYLDKWKQSHDGAYPIAYQDKIAFRNMVSDAMRRDNPEGGEENFEEAVGAVMKHVVKPDLPGTLKQVFECSHSSSVGHPGVLFKESMGFSDVLCSRRPGPVSGSLQMPCGSFMRKTTACL